MSAADAWSSSGGHSGDDAICVSDELPIGRCDDCTDDALVLDRVLLQHFAMRVCLACRQDRNLRDGAYELVSKGRAKSDFALPDSFFHGLAHMCKPNPRHESFAPLKLYLKQTIVSEAHRLYGGPDGLAKELETRRVRAYTSAAKRTKHLLKRKHVLQALDSDDSANEQSSQSQTQSQSSQSQSQAQKKTKAARTYVPVADRDHKHAFAAEVLDATANAWFKTCACGMKVEVEKW